MKRYYLFIFLVLPIVFLSACSQNKNVSTNEENLEASDDLSPQEDQTNFQKGDSFYEINTEASVVKWNAQKVSVRASHYFGTINPISGRVVLSENDELVGGNILVDMSSVKVFDTDSANLLNHIKSTDFFDVENHPTAEFVLKSAEKLENSDFDYLAVGDMIIKGKKNEIEIEVKLESSDGLLTFETRFEIERTELGIINGSENFFKELENNVIDDVIGFDIRIVAQE